MLGKCTRSAVAVLGWVLSWLALWRGAEVHVRNASSHAWYRLRLVQSIPERKVGPPLTARLGWFTVYVAAVLMNVLVFGVLGCVLDLVCICLGTVLMLLSIVHVRALATITRWTCCTRFASMRRTYRQRASSHIPEFVRRCDSYIDSGRGARPQAHQMPLELECPIPTPADGESDSDAETPEDDYSVPYVFCTWAGRPAPEPERKTALARPTTRLHPLSFATQLSARSPCLLWLVGVWWVFVESMCCYTVWTASLFAPWWLFRLSTGRDVYRMPVVCSQRSNRHAVFGARDNDGPPAPPVLMRQNSSQVYAALHRPPERVVGCLGVSGGMSVCAGVRKLRWHFYANVLWRVVSDVGIMMGFVVLAMLSPWRVFYMLAHIVGRFRLLRRKLKSSESDTHTHSYQRLRACACNADPGITAGPEEAGRPFRREFSLMAGSMALFESSRFSRWSRVYFRSYANVVLSDCGCVLLFLVGLVCVHPIPGMLRRLYIRAFCTLYKRAVQTRIPGAWEELQHFRIAAMPAFRDRQALYAIRFSEPAAAISTHELQVCLRRLYRQTANCLPPLWLFVRVAWRVFRRTGAGVMPLYWSLVGREGTRVTVNRPDHAPTQTLPDNIIFRHIIPYLDPVTVSRCAVVNQRWAREIPKLDHIWFNFTRCGAIDPRAKFDPTSPPGVVPRVPGANNNNNNAAVQRPVADRRGFGRLGFRRERMRFGPLRNFGFRQVRPVQDNESDDNKNNDNANDLHILPDTILDAVPVFQPAPSANVEEELIPSAHSTVPASNKKTSGPVKSDALVSVFLAYGAVEDPRAKHFEVHIRRHAMRYCGESMLRHQVHRDFLHPDFVVQLGDDAKSTTAKKALAQRRSWRRSKKRRKERSRMKKRFALSLVDKTKGSGGGVSGEQKQRPAPTSHDVSAFMAEHGAPWSRMERAFTRSEKYRNGINAHRNGYGQLVPDMQVDGAFRQVPGGWYNEFSQVYENTFREAVFDDGSAHSRMQIMKEELWRDGFKLLPHLLLLPLKLLVMLYPLMWVLYQLQLAMGWDRYTPLDRVGRYWRDMDECLGSYWNWHEFGVHAAKQLLTIIFHLRRVMLNVLLVPIMLIQILFNMILAVPLGRFGRVTMWVGRLIPICTMVIPGVAGMIIGTLNAVYFVLFGNDLLARVYLPDPNVMWLSPTVPRHHFERWAESLSVLSSAALYDSVINAFYPQSWWLHIAHVLLVIGMCCVFTYLAYRYIDNDGVRFAVMFSVQVVASALLFLIPEDDRWSWVHTVLRYGPGCMAFALGSVLQFGLGVLGLLGDQVSGSSAHLFTMLLRLPFQMLAGVVMGPSILMQASFGIDRLLVSNAECSREALRVVQTASNAEFLWKHPLTVLTRTVESLWALWMECDDGIISAWVPWWLMSVFSGVRGVMWGVLFGPIWVLRRLLDPRVLTYFYMLALAPALPGQDWNSAVMRVTDGGELAGAGLPGITVGSYLPASVNLTSVFPDRVDSVMPQLYERCWKAPWSALPVPSNDSAAYNNSITNAHVWEAVNQTADRRHLDVVRNLWSGVVAFDLTDWRALYQFDRLQSPTPVASANDTNGTTLSAADTNADADTNTVKSDKQAVSGANEDADSENFIVQFVKERWVWVVAVSFQLLAGQARAWWDVIRVLLSFLEMFGNATSWVQSNSSPESRDVLRTERFAPGNYTQLGNMTDNRFPDFSPYSDTLRVVRTYRALRQHYGTLWGSSMLVGPREGFLFYMTTVGGWLVCTCVTTPVMLAISVVLDLLQLICGALFSVHPPLRWIYSAVWMLACRVWVLLGGPLSVAMTLGGVLLMLGHGAPMKLMEWACNSCRRVFERRGRYMYMR